MENNDDNSNFIINEQVDDEFLLEVSKIKIASNENEGTGNENIEKGDVTVNEMKFSNEPEKNIDQPFLTEDYPHSFSVPKTQEPMWSSHSESSLDTKPKFVDIKGSVSCDKADKISTGRPILRRWTGKTINSEGIFISGIETFNPPCVGYIIQKSDVRSADPLNSVLASNEIMDEEQKYQGSEVNETCLEDKNIFQYEPKIYTTERNHGKETKFEENLEPKKNIKNVPMKLPRKKWKLLSHVNIKGVVNSVKKSCRESEEAASKWWWQFGHKNKQVNQNLTPCQEVLEDSVIEDLVLDENDLSQNTENEYIYDIPYTTETSEEYINLATGDQNYFVSEAELDYENNLDYEDNEVLIPTKWDHFGVEQSSHMGVETHLYESNDYNNSIQEVTETAYELEEIDKDESNFDDIDIFQHNVDENEEIDNVPLEEYYDSFKQEIVDQPLFNTEQYSENNISDYKTVLNDIVQKFMKSRMNIDENNQLVGDAFSSHFTDDIYGDKGSENDTINAAKTLLQNISFENINVETSIFDDSFTKFNDEVLGNTSVKAKQLSANYGDTVSDGDLEKKGDIVDCINSRINISTELQDVRSSRSLPFICEKGDMPLSNVNEENDNDEHNCARSSKSVINVDKKNNKNAAEPDSDETNVRISDPSNNENAIDTDIHNVPLYQRLISRVVKNQADSFIRDIREHYIYECGLSAVEADEALVSTLEKKLNDENLHKILLLDVMEEFRDYESVYRNSLSETDDEDDYFRQQEKVTDLTNRLSLNEDTFLEYIKKECAEILYNWEKSKCSNKQDYWADVHKYTYMGKKLGGNNSKDSASFAEDSELSSNSEYAFENSQIPMKCDKESKDDNLNDSNWSLEVETSLSMSESRLSESGSSSHKDDSRTKDKETEHFEPEELENEYFSC